MLAYRVSLVYRGTRVGRPLPIGEQPAKPHVKEMSLEERYHGRW